MKFLHIVIYISLLIPVHCYGADSPLTCFDRVANFDLPFEIYAEGTWPICKKFIQPLESSYGLSTKGVPFIECADEVTIAPLCSGNFIAVWKFSHEKFPLPLTGRIFDSDYRTLSKDFPVSENNELEEWEHSVSQLYDDGFVVTWKTWKTSSRKEIKLRGRIFDITGKPKGHSFDIYTTGNNNGGFVYGLPQGGFVVVWNNYKKDVFQGDALLIIFDKHGKPKTKEIIIESTPEDKSCVLKPRAYITKESIINIFMTCPSMMGFDRKYFFHSARSFTETGKPLTDILVGPAIQSLEGYKNLLEQYVREMASLHELRLRKFKKEFKERDNCYNELVFPSITLEMKTFTSDRRIKNFFAAYCMDYKKYCNVQKFAENFIEQCLQK